MPAMPDARTRLRPDSSRQRTSIVVFGIAFWMFVIGVRLVQLQLFQHEFLSERARRQQDSKYATNGARGLILDRQGRELARSLDVDSFFAEPKDIKDECATAQALAPLIGTNAAALEARLRDEKAA
jgi:cell division protein FtsI (penicillin-binding protein 3)